MSLFIQTLSKLNKGATASELDEALAQLTQQVRLTGKPGSLTLKITLKPQDNEGAMVAVSDRITVSTPELPRHHALFYTTEEGRLTRNDPNQPELPIVIDGGASAQPEQQEKAS